MKNILVIIALISFLFSIGQETENKIIKRYLDYGYNNPSETAILSIGRKLYFSGEEIPFSCLLLDQYLEPGNTYSEVLHLALISENNVQIDYPFDIKGGSVVSKFPVPNDIPTGNYQLVAFTKFMKNGDFQNLSHRMPIYIQNVLEQPKQVVKSMKNQEQSTDATTEEEHLTVIEHSDYMEIQINTERGNYYLLSEGFNNIQFVAQVSIKGKSKSLSIPKDRLKGQFQRLVLINEQLEVIGCHNYFLQRFVGIKNSINLSSQIKVGSTEKIDVSSQNNLFTTLGINKTELFTTDSIATFKRIFQSYYDIPTNISISEKSFSDLTSKNFLQKHCIYSRRKWDKILNSEKSKPIEISPEKGIILRGTITSEDISLDGFVRVHLFQNNLDIASPLYGEKDFKVNLLAPFGEDLMYISLYDENGEKIPENKFEFTFEETSLNYNSNVDYYEKSFTDSIISQKTKLKYILTTFDKIDERKRFFWEHKLVDETYYIDDYRSLADMPEFIREALPKTIVKKTGENSSMLWMYSSDRNRLFKNPPLIILDNKILDDPSEILQMPLDSIDQIKQVYKLNTLKRFGLTFNDGVFIVVTKEGNRKNSDLERKYFKKFFGYGLSNNGELINSFDENLIIDLMTDENKLIELKAGREIGEYQLISESFSPDGNYQRTYQSISIEK